MLDDWRIAAYNDEAVQGWVRYDDVTLLVHAFMYRNATDNLARLNVLPGDGSPNVIASYDLPAQGPAAPPELIVVDVPEGSRPSLEGAGVQLEWPIWPTPA